MRVSHETIYQSLFVQGRGELRRELARCLRSGADLPQEARRRRSPWPDPGHGQYLRTSPRSPTERCPRHWEGGLILGEGGRSAVGTLVERTTRLVLLLHLDGARSAVTVEAAMRESIAALPAQLRRSITWDQGAEMAAPCELHHSDRDPDLRLRSARPLAARIEREHQRTAAPVLAESHRPVEELRG
ncbi:MAG: transposase [Gaiellales bacterium]